jgi:Transglycosylase-like domain
MLGMSIPVVRRAAIVLALGLVGALVGPAGVAAARGTGGDGTGPVGPYADLLVATATDDIRYPWEAIPPPILGVLATRSNARIEALRALEAAQQQAAIAAYEAAAHAAARPKAAPAATASSGGGGGTSSSRCAGDFDCFKPCTLNIESHGDYGAVSSGGTYRGAWQFDQSTWNGAVARAGSPEWSGHDPASAPSGVQDAAARQLYAERGNQPWGGRC